MYLPTHLRLYDVSKYLSSIYVKQGCILPPCPMARVEFWSTKELMKGFSLILTNTVHVSGGAKKMAQL